MQLCLVTREYPALGSHGGIGTYTRNLAQGLADRGHRVSVIARADEPTAPFWEGGVRIEPVSPVERWRLPVGNRYLGKALRALPFAAAAAARFAALDRETPFDLVEVPEYQGWGLGVAHQARCPVVVRLHSHSKLVSRLNDSPADLDLAAVSALEALTIRRGDRVLANSAALAEVCAADLKLPIERIGVLPLGIDTQAFAPQARHWLPNHLGLEPGTPILLYVGRLERRKGVEVLVEAFARVLAAQPRATLVLAGFSTDTGPQGAPLLAHLRDRVAAMGAGERVRFLGHVPYEQLPLYYSGCDVFVAPSLYEPFGMIYLEAMACGRATVGSRAGGVPEILTTGETGLMVPPGNAEALGTALAALLAAPDERERLGRQARACVEARFSLPVIAARTEGHYRELVEARAIAPAGKEWTYARPR